MLDGRELEPNPNVPDAVWALWEELPTETLPQRGARPVERLVALAQALAVDGLRPGALGEVEGEVQRRLDGLEAQRIGTHPGDHRFRQSMSLAVIKKVTARAN